MSGVLIGAFSKFFGDRGDALLYLREALNI